MKPRFQHGAMTVIDLRSDTVTQPTTEMREAMAAASVGDDVFGEDPTVHELEAFAADLLNKEAALFVPTGTMGNLMAAMSHCNERGSEMIVGDRQHMFLYEQGGVSALAGIHPAVLRNAPDGTLPVHDLEAAIREEDDHMPVTRMVAIENTHNSCGGIPLPASYVDQVGALARKHGLKLHVDGARVFNAAAALDTSAARLCQAADSVSVCLSKGLGAPAGSVVVGQRDFVKRCRRARKALGGGMRQAGVLAAAGLVGLKVIAPLLGKDHANAQRLALGLSEMPKVQLDPAAVRTNIVFFELPAGGAVQVSEALKRDHGVLVGSYSDTRMRAVVHHQAGRQHVDRALEAFRKVLSSR